MKTIEVSDDQNTVVVDGVKYEAVKYINCRICAFHKLGGVTTYECQESPCMSYERKDKTDIAFKKSEQ